jgi:hypothetical protein
MCFSELLNSAERAKPYLFGRAIVKTLRRKFFTQLKAHDVLLGAVKQRRESEAVLVRQSDSKKLQDEGFLHS